MTISDGTEGLDARADLLVRMPKGPSSRLPGDRVGTVANVDGELTWTRTARRSPPPGPGQLSVDVGAGDVRITQARGDADVDTGSGAVEVTGFQGTVLSIDTGSGEVTGSDLVSDELSVDTGSGEIRLTT